MARKTSKFMIGLFVTLGALIGMTAIVWLGASKYFEKGRTCVTYFDESVQGLQVDSAVKYRGVEVGRVTKIGVAPDDYLIEVVMKVNLEGDLEKDYVARLKAAGITGIVFIELNRKDPGKPDETPRLNFVAEYPVISSEPSEIKQILSGVDAVIQSIKQIDTKGISDQIKATTKEIENVVGGKSMKAILAGLEATVENLNRVAQRADRILAAANLEDVLVEARSSLVKVQSLTATVEEEVRALNLSRTGASLESAAARVDQFLASGGEVEAILTGSKGTLAKLESAAARVDHVLAPGGEVETILSEARQTLSKAQTAMEELKEGVHSLKIAEMTGRVNLVLEGVDKRSYALTREIMITSDTLRGALDSLQMLLDRINNSPSDLLFSQPPPPIKMK